MIFCLLFDVSISFLYQNNARLLFWMLSHQDAEPVFGRAVTNASYCCLPISFADLTDSDKALLSACLETICTKEESSFRNGFPSYRNDVRKAFLSFKKPSSNYFVSSWWFNLIDLLQCFSDCSNISLVIGLATAHLRKVFSFHSNPIAPPSIFTT